MDKSGGKYGPKVLELMSLKLARLAFLAGGCDADDALGILDEKNSDLHAKMTQHAYRWTMKSLNLCKRIPSMAGKTDDEVAQAIMDIIGMDPTSPCQCCGEYH